MDCNTIRLIQSFPVLHELRIYSDREEELGLSDDEMDERREENILAQEEHGSWSLLENFQAPVDVLYVLAPTCHIKVITTHLLTPTDRILFQFGLALTTARPLRLNLTLRRSSVDAIGSVLDAIPKIPGLRKLDFTMVYRLQAEPIENIVVRHI